MIDAKAVMYPQADGRFALRQAGTANHICENIPDHESAARLLELWNDSRAEQLRRLAASNPNHSLGTWGV